MHAYEILFSPTGGTAKVAASGDPDKLEDVARSELGMVESGEKVFYETGS